MAEDVAKIVALLGRMAAFKPLKPPQLEALAKDFEVLEVAENEVLIAEGDIGADFYIVFAGRLKVTHHSSVEGVPEEFLGYMVPGDHLGEEALLYGTPRTATVVAIVPSKVLRLELDKFAALIERHPVVIPYFVATVDSHRMARKLHFDWLNADETIYLLVRKHVAYLIYKLAVPLALSLVAWPFLLPAVWFFSGVTQWIFGLIGLGFFVVALAMGVWEYIDWGNDYYIVTNQRVVWLERVIALYDSREEAPLGTVVAVNIQSEQWGRWLGYGDVVIRTYTGSITMRHVAHPSTLAGLLDELVGRGKQAARQAESDAIDRAIRARLGLSSPAAAPAPPAAPMQHVRQMGLARKLMADFFRMRYEEGNKITFRKHWIVLLRDTAWPNVFLSSITLLLILRLANVYTFLSVLMVFELWFSFTMFLLVWWVYGYVDWRNDIYQVTDDMILDIYRKPLGEETKKTASIDNILSLQHTREGLLRLLLNYGNVVANVGTDQFTFLDVYNPSEVEHEIFHRIAQRKRKAREAEIVQQREYIADWLAAYHRQVTQLQSNQPKTG
ncbi:MAG: cyclic nucleotide-binding domain-containing protein [Chloroflexota bacterium]